MNNFERPDHDTEKFGRMFAELFFADEAFRDSGCVVLENVCADYIEEYRQKEEKEADMEDFLSLEEETYFGEDELEGLELLMEDDSECFELVIIRENRVLAAVSVADLSISGGYAQTFYGLSPNGRYYRRREDFHRMVRANFGGMGFVEIERKSCGWNVKKKVVSSFEEELFDGEAPLKEEIRWMETDDYQRVRDVVLENLRKEKPLEYRIQFRDPGQDVFTDEKALRSLMREGLIRRDLPVNHNIHITASGRSKGLVTAYRRGESKVEQVLMALDDGKQYFDTIRRWELGKQSPEEEMEIFGWPDQR